MTDTRNTLIEWLDKNGINENPTRDHDKQCKSLFCPYESEITVYSEEYEERIDVCSVCVAEKVGVKEVPDRRRMLGEMANRSFDEPLPWEIISDTTAADLGIEGQ